MILNVPNLANCFSTAGTNLSRLTDIGWMAPSNSKSTSNAAGEVPVPDAATLSKDSEENSSGFIFHRTTTDEDNQLENLKKRKSSPL